MWTNMKTSLAAVAALCMLQSAHGIKVKVTNMCADEFELSHVGKSVIYSVEKIVPGSTMTKEVPNESPSHVFKAGRGGQATLAEISQKGGMVWYDISIIPTGDKSGPEHCMGLDACKKLTGGVGYNKPMQIIPAGPGGRRFPGCIPLTCMNDGCQDAYLFPDDKKTHACPGDMDLEVIFCPGGPGKQTPPPTPAPTPAPTPTPTPAPTPAPTPPPTETPVPTAANESSVLDLNGGFLGAGSSGSEGAVIEDRSLDITEAPATEAPATEAPVVVAAPQAPQAEQATEANTKSSMETSTGATTYVVLSVGAAAMVAAAAIFVLRRKKQQLEAMDEKTPRPTTTVAANAFMLSTPKDTTIL